LAAFRKIARVDYFLITVEHDAKHESVRKYAPIDAD
jgi:hypothetical protein